MEACSPSGPAKLPAHAGVILMFKLNENSMVEATRTRGGDPHANAILLIGYKSYPHTRG